MKNLIILLTATLLAHTFVFSQEYEEIDIKSSKKKDEKTEPHLHPRANVPVMIGCKATFIGSQFYIGSKFNLQYAFKENKRHKIGAVIDFLFSQTSITDNGIHTYIDFFDDTITGKVNHMFYLWNFGPQYDFYALLPNVRGMGLRFGINACLSIQNPDFAPKEEQFNMRLGFMSEATIGIEYRFEFNFGLYAEASGGFYHFSRKIPHMPYYNNFIASLSVGILYDFALMKKD